MLVLPEGIHLICLFDSHSQSFLMSPEVPFLKKCTLLKFNSSPLESLDKEAGSSSKHDISGVNGKLKKLLGSNSKRTVHQSGCCPIM